METTRGQEIVYSMLRGSGTNIVLFCGGGFVGFSVAEGTDDWARTGIAQVVAAAIDAAIAEQREKDAKTVERYIGRPASETAAVIRTGL